MPRQESCSLKEECGTSTFTDSSNSAEAARQQHTNSTGNRHDHQHGDSNGNSDNNNSSHCRNLYRGALHIELPHNGSPPCTSPASPAEVTSTTTNKSPRTAIYRQPEGAAFTREREECTPVMLAERHARQSAMALLHADISSKAHLAYTGSRSAIAFSPPPPQQLSSSQRQPSHQLYNPNTSVSPVASGSFEMSEGPTPVPALPAKKKALPQQLFTTCARQNRGALSSSSCAFNNGLLDVRTRDISTALDLTSGANPESHRHSPAVKPAPTPLPGSRSNESQLPPRLILSRLAASFTSAERLTGSASASSPLPQPIAGAATSTSGPMATPLPVLCTNGNNKNMPSKRINRSSSKIGGGVIPPATPSDDDDAEGSSDSSGQHIGMEAVLRDASKVRGIRLSWLLYMLIVIVIVLFTLLLVQIIYESNRTLVRTATQAVRAQASALSNSIDLENYALMSVFVLMHEMNVESLNPSDAMYPVVRGNFCSRLYGAPVAFALYSGTGDIVWRMRCAFSPMSGREQKLPERIMPGPAAVRVVDFTWSTVLAQYSFYSSEHSSIETFAMLMDKETLGRTLLGKRFPQYSSSTLQYVTSAFLTRMYNGSGPRILFHTLTKAHTTYASTESGTVHDSLGALFEKICYEGSPYVWHTVSHYPMDDSSHWSSSGDTEDRMEAYARWPNTTTNEIPTPYLEYGRSWGQLSVANICGLQCFGDAGDTTCDFTNPTNIWFVVEYSLSKQNGLSGILNVVGSVSIVALVIFSFVMFLVYISITVPVSFLRVQLLKAVGATDTQTNFQRKIVGWTYRLWLGDLTAIVRSTHILSSCFKLNKKYVPDHVLRSHAQQLFLRRRKFNFLEDVDLKDDQADLEGTGSESDLEPTLAQLPPGVSSVIPSSESRFLWRFAAANDGDDGGAVRQSADVDVLNVNEWPNNTTASSPTAAPTSAAAVKRPSGEVLSLAPPRAVCGSVDSSSVFVKLTRSLKPASTFANDSGTAVPPWPMGELDNPPYNFTGEQDASLAMSTVQCNNFGRNSFNTMMIRRESESTILCVRIPSVELAYLLNYSAAVVQHRRIMRILMHRIRRHKGALFHRSGDCLAAVWNAFEGCPNHAETAAVCAQEIANAFAPFRVDGLHVGLVLHQGVLVCGTVEYSKAAFVTAFGDGPREAVAIADLAAMVGSFNVIVSEPVKQNLSGLYDCNIVDVVQLPNSAHPLLLFELGSSRSCYPMPAPSLRAQFAVEYARVFAQFRNHEFREALQGIEHIRLSLSGAQNEHLLRRLEQLCFFFAATPTTLPYPYIRPLPVWENYEAIAQAGLQNSAHLFPLRNSSMLSRSFMDGVVYKGVPTVPNEVEYIKDFKQELQENMRRTARKGNGSPTMDESSTRPHTTPQSSPPLRPTPAPTMRSEPVMSVGSGMELMTDASSSASPKSRHADPSDWRNSARTSTMELPAPLPNSNNNNSSNNTTNITAVPSLSNLPTMPLVTFDALRIFATEPVAEDVKDVPPVAAAGAPAAATAEYASVNGSSIKTMDSPRDVLALSNRFAMTHRVANGPPVAFAAASPSVPELTAERLVATTLTHNSGSHNDNPNNSIIMSAGMSFKNSVNMVRRGGVVGSGSTLQNLSVTANALPVEIKAKSGTTYLRSTRVLGRGSFGCVYLGMDAHSGRLVAIKFLPLPSDESGMEDIEAEVLILQRVNDTHVVQLLSYAFEGDAIVIIMECMLAGSLQNMISAFGSIPSSTARVFMRDILRGLSKIHSMGVIHRDMKPQNVLLSLAGNCKISDFGASAWLQELVRKESQGQVCGTPVYLAPEAARGNPAKESDIWSCGIMFLQMLTGALPYPAKQLSAGAAVLVFQIGSGIAQPQIPADLDELDAEFVRACLQVEPSKRLTASALLQLPIFTV